MLPLLLSALIGIDAGLRSLVAPTAISWAAYLGWLNLDGSWLAFLGNPVTPWILTLLALGELFMDQRPSTPSRTAPVAFGVRIAMGALSGAAIGIAVGMVLGGIVAGIVGAVIGTLGGHAARVRIAAAFGQDRPAALLEDAVAIIGALLIVRAV